MKEWSPLLEALVWPVFYLILLLTARRPIRRLFSAVEERLAQGAAIEAGASGIKIGVAPKLTEIEVNSPTAPEQLTGKGRQDSGVAPNDGPPVPGKLYLVHTARRDRSLDRAELRYYRIRLYLDADDPTTLDSVQRVIYYLHESFREPVREARDRRTSFEIRTTVWGEFNAAARVYLASGQTVQLERYLNL